MTFVAGAEPQEEGTGLATFDSGGTGTLTNSIQNSLVSSSIVPSVQSTGSLQNASLGSINPKTGFDNNVLSLQASVTNVTGTGALQNASLGSLNPKTGFSSISNQFLFGSSVTNVIPTAIIAMAEIKATSPITGFSSAGLLPSVLVAQGGAISYEVLIG